MKQKEFIKAIAEKTGFTQKDIKDAVDGVFDVIADALADGDSVSIPGFGKFTIADRAERTGHNPMTGETLIIPAKKSPKFKASTRLKEAVNE